MQERRVEKEDGKAFGAHEIRVEVEFLHPAYDAPVVTRREITRHGLLVVLEIRPRENPTLPFFTGRWDEKDTALDFDCFEGGSTVPEKRFVGHHSTLVPGEGRRFEVRVETPGGEPVFRGVVSFGLERRMGLDLRVQPGFSPEAEVIRPPKRNED